MISRLKEYLIFIFLIIPFLPFDKATFLLMPFSLLVFIIPEIFFFAHFIFIFYLLTRLLIIDHFFVLNYALICFSVYASKKLKFSSLNLLILMLGEMIIFSFRVNTAFIMPSILGLIIFSSHELKDKKIALLIIPLLLTMMISFNISFFQPDKSISKEEETVKINRVEEKNPVQPNTSLQLVPPDSSQSPESLFLKLVTNPESLIPLIVVIILIIMAVSIVIIIIKGFSKEMLSKKYFWGIIWRLVLIAVVISSGFYTFIFATESISEKLSNLMNQSKVMFNNILPETGSKNTEIKTKSEQQEETVKQINISNILSIFIGVISITIFLYWLKNYIYKSKTEADKTKHKLRFYKEKEITYQNLYETYTLIRSLYYAGYDNLTPYEILKIKPHPEELKKLTELIILEDYAKKTINITLEELKDLFEKIINFYETNSAK